VQVKKKNQRNENQLYKNEFIILKYSKFKMFYPSEELVEILNKIGVPKQTNENWLCMPLQFTNTESWTIDNKIGLLYLRAYIYHYLKSNNLLKFSRMVYPNELLKKLEPEMSQISYKHFIAVLETHLYIS